MKKKIKRMLAWILQDELIELIKHKNIKRFEVIDRTIEFETLKFEYEIPLTSFHRNPYEYEHQLELAKHELLSEAEKYIQIESAPLVNKEYGDHRFVRLKLRLQAKQVH